MITKTKKIITFCWSIRKQIAKYIIVGVSSFAIDYGIFFLLFKKAGWWYLGATLVSQAIAIAYNFTLNRNWSFQSNGAKKKQFAKYMALQAWNYIFMAVAIFVFVQYFFIDPLIAKVLAIAIVVSWNFIVYKFIVYKE